MSKLEIDRESVIKRLRFRCIDCGHGSGHQRSSLHLQYQHILASKLHGTLIEVYSVRGAQATERALCKMLISLANRANGPPLWTSGGEGKKSFY